MVAEVSQATNWSGAMAGPAGLLRGLGSVDVLGAGGRMLNVRSRWLLLAAAIARASESVRTMRSWAALATTNSSLRLAGAVS